METPRQELRRLRQIVNHIEKLSPAGEQWLRSWLSDPATVVSLYEARAEREARSA